MEIKNNDGEFKKYLNLRNNALNYTYNDMNLKLENDNQVYIAVADIPVESKIIGFHSQTLVLIYGLNTHIYCSNGQVITKLEKFTNVMNAMQSLFISCPQVLHNMKLTEDVNYYDSDKIRIYLKCRKGIYFREIKSVLKEDRFLKMLIDNVLFEIAHVL
jgi:hypothetical protein